MTRKILEITGSYVDEKTAMKIQLFAPKEKYKKKHDIMISLQ